MLGTGALSATLAILFVVRGLHRRYPIFFCYWVFDVIQSTFLYLPGSPRLIHEIQIGAWMIQWVFYFLLVLELVDRILSDHPGIARLGHRLFQALMVAAVLCSLYTLRLDPAANPTVNQTLRLLLQVERVVAGCLLIFLLLIILFLWYFPVRLNRNTKAYCWGFTLLFLVKSIVPYFLNSFGLDFLRLANSIHMGGIFLCQSTWLVSITQRGVDRTPAFDRHWTPGEQQKVLSTLDAFERNISRTRDR